MNDSTPMSRTRSTYGWAEVSAERKREIIDAIVSGTPTAGPVHAELDLTDRCNVACYFCNQQDVRTKQQIPIRRAAEIIDELADAGLRSVRLSGGGDPLFHREILDVLDHLERRGIVIDNLTTNAVALDQTIAERLVRSRAREVIVSLNAADAADYHRMMQVKPALFDQVLDNVRRLIRVRGDSASPSVVMQFLIDTENYRKLPQMYALGRELGADTIAINPVQEIPRDRIDAARLLPREAFHLVRPFVEEIIRADRDASLLQIYFPHPEWNQMLDEVLSANQVSISRGFTTAPSFREENGGCFFAWYSMTVTGNGDLYPCCLLLNPDYQPLGNGGSGSIVGQWRGERFSKLRDEMREVLLTGNRIVYRPRRFETLKPQCVTPGACYLKNMYFRADDEFYRDLGAALREAREKEIRILGGRRRAVRRLEILFHDNRPLRSAYEWLRRRTRPLRLWLKARTRINLVSG